MKFTPYRIRKRIEETISPEEVDVTDISKLKSGLNGKIWQKNGTLKTEVREKMIELAKEFYKTLRLDYPIVDIHFTGGLANYNWTNHSDADVHIIFDMKGEEDNLLPEYILCKKDAWSEKHNITLYGFPVELYATDSEEGRLNQAIYSVIKNDWIKPRGGLWTSPIKKEF